MAKFITAIALLGCVEGRRKFAGDHNERLGAAEQTTHVEPRKAFSSLLLTSYPSSSFQLSNVGSPARFVRGMSPFMEDGPEEKKDASPQPVVLDEKEEQSGFPSIPNPFGFGGDDKKKETLRVPKEEESGFPSIPSIPNPWATEEKKEKTEQVPDETLRVPDRDYDEEEKAAKPAGREYIGKEDEEEEWDFEKAMYDNAGNEAPVGEEAQMQKARMQTDLNNPYIKEMIQNRQEAMAAGKIKLREESKIVWSSPFWLLDSNPEGTAKLQEEMGQMGVDGYNIVGPTTGERLIIVGNGDSVIPTLVGGFVVLAFTFYFLPGLFPEDPDMATDAVQSLAETYLDPYTYEPPPTPTFGTNNPDLNVR